MVVGINEIATCDKLSETHGSYKRQGVLVGDKVFCRWAGYALVQPGVMATELNIVVPSQQRGMANLEYLQTPEGACITSLGIQPLGDLTLAAPTGKLKFTFSSGLATEGPQWFVETDAAVGGVLSMPTQPMMSHTYLFDATSQVAVASTWKIFATDGVAGPSTGASTVTAGEETKVLVSIGFYVPAGFPTEDDIGYSAPTGN